MEGLSKYFQKIKLVLQDKTEEKRVIQSVIHSASGVSVNLESILIKNCVVTLTISPIERVEIALKKKNIIFDLQEKGIVVTDFR